MSLPTEFHSSLEKTLIENAYDLKNPLWVFPSECAKENSPFLPKKELNIIALVGDATSQEMTLMQSYLEGLISQQKKASAALKATLNLTYPNFEFKNYATMADLESFIASPDYGNPDVQNVCYGFELAKQGDSDYALTLVMND